MLISHYNFPIYPQNPQKFRAPSARIIYSKMCKIPLEKRFFARLQRAQFYAESVEKRCKKIASGGKLARIRFRREINGDWYILWETNFTEKSYTFWQEIKILKKCWREINSYFPVKGWGILILYPR